MIHYKNHLQLIGYKESSIKNFIKIAQEYNDFENKNFEEYYQYLKTRNHKQNPIKTLSKNTLNFHLYGLKIYQNYLEKQDLNHKENRNFTFLKEKKVLQKIDVLSIEEVQDLFKNSQSIRDTAVLSCLYHLGMRASEACNLQLEDVDFDTHLVFISDSKTGYQRQIPMSKTAKTNFENYLKIRKSKADNPYFLLGLKGKLTTDGLAQIVKKTAQKSQIIKRIYPHLLRHSIATHLLINKMEINQVAQFLGHKSLESTQRYTHLLEEL